MPPLPGSMTSTPKRTRPRRYGCDGIDARVQERDRHAGAVETRDLEVGDGRGEHASGLRGLRRVGDADRVDAHHLAIGVEERERRRVEARGEPVDDARVPVLRRDPRADSREAREELVLLRDSHGRPRTHLLLRCFPSCSAHLRGERRRLQEDDVALRGGDGRPDAEHALPAGLVDRRRRLLRATSRGAEDERDGRSGTEQDCVTRATHRHRGQGSEGTDAPRRTARTRRSWPRCRCTGRGARTRRRAGRCAARSSPRRRRRPRSVRDP